MKADFSFEIADAQIITNKPLKGMMLRFQTIDRSQGAPRRSGKFVHLTMTAAGAMAILDMLQKVKQEHGLRSVSDEPLVTPVPPAKDRH